MYKKINYFYFISILTVISSFILLPIFYGIAGVLTTSLGYFPNVTNESNFDFFKMIFEIPGIAKSTFLTLFVSLSATFISLIISQVILLKLYDTKFYKYLFRIITPINCVSAI